VAESRSKVLLVEDSKFLRIVNGRALAKAGYEVSTAEDGEQALQVACDTLPDVILLDMLIPKLSGPDVLKALKNNPATMAIPVIVLSSLSQKNKQKLKEMGAVEYLEKGSLDLEKHPDRLATAVETVLRRCRQRRQEGT